MLYSVIWSQFTELTRKRIQEVPEYKKINSDADSLSLVKVIRNQAFNFQSQQDLAQALFEETLWLQKLVQDQNMTAKRTGTDSKMPWMVSSILSGLCLYLHHWLSVKNIER